MSKTKIKLEKFSKALKALEEIYLKPMKRDRSNIDATIQRFEFTFELSWKFLKDYLYEKGLDLYYPKDVLKEAFAAGLIDHESVWSTMLSDRNLTLHTYDEKLADAIYMRIRNYVPEFKNLLEKVNQDL